MNILAIGAHPDDMELGCFGTLARHNMNGDKIFGALITRGELGGNPNKRQAEAMESAKLVNMKLFQGNFRDGDIRENSLLVTFLDEIIDKHDIDIIYTHSEHDKHQDHRMVAKASISASRRINELYSYEISSVLYPFNPQLFVDVTDTFKTKVAALKKHETQSQRIYMRIEAVEGLAKFRANQCSLVNRLCESFEVHKILRNDRVKSRKSKNNLNSTR